MIAIIITQANTEGSQKVEVKDDRAEMRALLLELDKWRLRADIDAYVGINQVWLKLTAWAAEEVKKG